MQQLTCDTATCFLCRACIPEWAGLTALRKETLSFKKGEVLFREGDPVTGIYYSLSGIVKVHQQWGDGKELIIRFATGGDIIGLRGLSGNQTFPVSATALEPVTACFIPNDFLEISLKANPSFSYQLMQYYAAELQKTEQRMSDLVHMDVKGRIARALLDLKAIVGTDKSGFLNISISRQDIASYAGTIYETVFKTFTEWIQASLIATEGKRIRLRNEKKLQAFIH